MCLSDISTLRLLLVIQEDKWAGLKASEKENKSFAVAGNQASIRRFFSLLDIYGTDHDILALYVRMCGCKLSY
jgi:hypothetical protein